MELPQPKKRGPPQGLENKKCRKQLNVDDREHDTEDDVTREIDDSTLEGESGCTSPAKNQQ